MTNEMAKSLISLTPYIAACVRGVGRNYGTILADADVDDVAGTVLEKLLKVEEIRAESVKCLVKTYARTTTVDFLKSGHFATVYQGSTVNVTDARVSESDSDDTASVGLTLTDSADAESMLMARERLTMVKDAIESLPESFRSVMLAMMDAGDDFDAESYAASVGVKYGTMRVRINRAREALVEALEA